MEPDPHKVSAVKNFPRPKTEKNVKQLLGLVGYYRKFIPQFAKITKPFTLLLKKNMCFNWGSEQENAFRSLISILCSEPLLQYPDFTKPFIVTSGASQWAVGSVLSQGEIGSDLPIAYASRTLNDAESRYLVIEKELLAIIFAVKTFRPYLFGKKFILITDHQPLIWNNGCKDPSSRLMRWKIKLNDYDYDIV